jgi:Putative auto-transporter adhesin, head GIN domain
MTTTAPPLPEAPADQRHRRRRSIALIGAAVLIALVALTVSVLLAGKNDHDVVTGSGTPATDVRALPQFSAVDLAGANRVTVRVGTPQRVVVHADSNLLDNVLTRVRSGVLIVSGRGHFTTRSPMAVVVTVPSLRAATLSGTGELTVTGAATSTFVARLSGTGTLTASGQADRVTATLTGAGTLNLASLRARNMTVVLRGAGTATVHATDSLNATLAGTGSILYSGSPAHVTKTLTGTGTIAAT